MTSRSAGRFARLRADQFEALGDVVFAIGSEPTLTAEDGQALVALIAADPTPFTVRLAAKINESPWTAQIQAMSSSSVTSSQRSPTH